MGTIQKRPINLNLLTIQFPITAIVSIIHRVTGVLLFFFTPVMLWMLSQSLNSEASYSAMFASFKQPCWQIVLFVGFGSFTYHMLAGLRHIVMDLGLGESKEEGKASAWILLLLFVLCLIPWGAWIW